MDFFLLKKKKNFYNGFGREVGLELGTNNEAYLASNNAPIVDKLNHLAILSFVTCLN